MKSEAIKELQRLATEAAKAKHPGMPSHYIAPRQYNDITANSLTIAILAFLRIKGHQAERIAVSGRYIDNSKIVKDTLGFSRKIGSGKWIPGSMQPGSADISATLKNKSGIGISVKIEVKMKDKQSPDQKKYEEQIIRAGGVYWIVRSFEEFITLYNNMV